MEQQRHVRNAAAGPAPLPGGSSGAQVQLQAAAAAELQQEASGGQAPRRRQLYDDDFMIWVWKIEMCKRTDQHDRKECPYAHPGELARRRHPSIYQALPCPEARAVSGLLRGCSPTACPLSPVWLHAVDLLYIQAGELPAHACVLDVPHHSACQICLCWPDLLP